MKNIGMRADFSVTSTNKSCTIDNHKFKDRINFKKVAEAFKRHGFDVTEAALEHNYSAWMADFKSGYLDKENGYFLWTPCGCNPLSFYAEKLNGKEYQQTYIC